MNTLQQIVYLKALGMMTLNERVSLQDFCLKLKELKNNEFPQEEFERQLTEMVNFIFYNLEVNKSFVLDSVIQTLIERFPNLKKKLQLLQIDIYCRIDFPQNYLHFVNKYIEENGLDKDIAIAKLNILLTDSNKYQESISELVTYINKN